MRIDVHQHFWKYSQAAYPWISDHLAVLKRDFLPSDLQPLLQAHQIDGCVSVQARQSEAESQFLLDLADAFPFIRGVVGWVDLCREDAGERMAHFAAHPKFKGIRHILQDEKDDRFMLRKDFQQGISQLEKYGLTYDILIYPRHIQYAVELVSKFPNQPFVIDHLAKPIIRVGDLADWRNGIEALARFENVHCKLSGMVTEASWHNWCAGDFKPCLDTVFESFGINRVMMGSDWPVCLLAAGYEEVLAIVEDYIQDFSSEEQQKIMGLNAVSFYNL